MGKGFTAGIQPGDLYQADNGDVYRVIAYQPAPTIILERILNRHKYPVPDTEREQETYALHDMNANKFTRLVLSD